MDRKYIFAISFLIGLSILGIFLVWLFTKGKKATIEKFTSLPNTTYIANSSIPITELQAIYGSHISANNPVLGRSIDLTSVTLNSLIEDIQTADTTVYSANNFFISNPATDTVTKIDSKTITISNPNLMYTPYAVFVLGTETGNYLPNQFTIESVSISQTSTTITCMSSIPTVDVDGIPITLISILPFAIQYGTIAESPQINIEDDNTMAQQRASSASSLTASFGGGYGGFAVSASYSSSSAEQTDNTQKTSTYKMIIKQDIQRVEIDQTSPLFCSSINNQIFVDMLQTFMPPPYSILKSLQPLPATLPSYTNQSFISRFPFTFLGKEQNPNPLENTLEGCWIPGDAYDLAFGCSNAIQTVAPAKSLFVSNVQSAAAVQGTTNIAKSDACFNCGSGGTCMQSTKNPPPFPAPPAPPAINPIPSGTPMWSGQCMIENTKAMTDVNLTGTFNPQNIFYYNLEVNNQIVLLPYLNFSDGPFCMGPADCAPGMFCSAFDATCKPEFANSLDYGTVTKSQDWWTTHNIMNPPTTTNAWKGASPTGSYPSELCYSIYPDNPTPATINCPYVQDANLCCNSTDTSQTSFGFNSGYQFTNYTPTSNPALFKPTSTTSGPIGDNTIDASTWISGGRTMTDLSSLPIPQFIYPTNNKSILRQALSALKLAINTSYGSVILTGFTLGASITSTLLTSLTGTALATQQTQSFCVGASYGKPTPTASCQPGDDGSVTQPAPPATPVAPSTSTTPADDSKTPATTEPPPGPPPGAVVQGEDANSLVKQPSDPPPEGFRHRKNIKSHPRVYIKSKFIERYVSATASPQTSAAMMQCQLSQQNSAGSVSASVCSANSSSTDSTTTTGSSTTTISVIGGPMNTIPISSQLPSADDMSLFFNNLNITNAAKTAFVFQPISTLLKSYINIMFSPTNSNPASNPMARTEGVASVIPQTVSVDPSNNPTNFSFQVPGSVISSLAIGSIVSYVSGGLTAYQNYAAIAPGAVVQLGSVASFTSNTNGRGKVTVTVTMNSSIDATLGSEASDVEVTFTPSAAFATNINVQIDVWMASLGSEYWLQLIQLYELSQISDEFCLDTMGTYNSFDSNNTLTQTNFWVQKLLQDNSIDSALTPTSTSPGFANIKRKYVCNVVNDSTCTVNTSNVSVLNSGFYENGIPAASGAPGACLKENSAGGWMAGGGGSGDVGVGVQGGNGNTNFYQPGQFSTIYGSNMIQLSTDPNMLLCEKGNNTQRTYTRPGINQGNIQLNQNTTNCYGSGSCGQPTGASMSTAWDSQNNYKCANTVSTTGQTVYGGPYSPAPLTYTPISAVSSGTVSPDVAAYCGKNPPSCTNPKPVYNPTNSTTIEGVTSCGDGLSLSQIQSCLTDYCSATGDFTPATSGANPQVCRGIGAPGLNPMLSPTPCSGFSYSTATGYLKSPFPTMCNTTATNWCTDYPEESENPYTGANCPITSINSAMFCDYNPSSPNCKNVNNKWVYTSTTP